MLDTAGDMTFRQVCIGMKLHDKGTVHGQQGIYRMLPSRVLFDRGPMDAAEDLSVLLQEICHPQRPMS